MVQYVLKYGADGRRNWFGSLHLYIYPSYKHGTINDRLSCKPAAPAPLAPFFFLLLFSLIEAFNWGRYLTDAGKDMKTMECLEYLEYPPGSRTC
jgi:hypothetical protein